MEYLKQRRSTNLCLDLDRRSCRSYGGTVLYNVDSADNIPAAARVSNTYQNQEITYTSKLRIPHLPELT